MALKGTVTVTKIDMKTRIVTLTGPEGRSYKVKAGKEVAIEKLKVGDKVLAEYQETVGHRGRAGSEEGEEVGHEVAPSLVSCARGAPTRSLLARAILAGALLGAAPAFASAEEPSERREAAPADTPSSPGHEKAPDLETAFPPAARPGPVEETPIIDPSRGHDGPARGHHARARAATTRPRRRRLEAERKQKFHWNAVPFILTSPLIGFGFGVAGAGVFRFDDEVTRLSKFATNILYTVKNQVSIPLRTSIYFGGGDWSLVGYTNWQIFPAPTWGLGGNTPGPGRGHRRQEPDPALGDRLPARALRPLRRGRPLLGSLLLGERPGRGPGVVNPFTSYPYGTTGPYDNMGVSVDLLWESRDNPVNATHGYYATATYRAFPRWLGSTYDWQSLYVDGRAYFSLPKPHVLALWAYGWFSFGNTPYLNLPSIGSDPDARSGRGYIEGRHIGKSLLYAEAEYRFRIWDFIGGVVGVNVHSASQTAAARGAAERARLPVLVPGGHRRHPRAA